MGKRSYLGITVIFHVSRLSATFAGRFKGLSLAFGVVVALLMTAFTPFVGHWFLDGLSLVTSRVTIFVAYFEYPWVESWLLDSFEVIDVDRVVGGVAS
jgi:hypothetical protein